MLGSRCDKLKTIVWRALFMSAALALAACGAPEASAPSLDQKASAPSPVGIAASVPNMADPNPGASQTGDFDFYVLSLSWSPTYCLDAGEQADPAQCEGRRPLFFVVHGLWPQHEKGYPEDCAAQNSPRPGAKLIDSMLDIMPSRALIRHEWSAHGLCAGMTPEDYFAAVRKARAQVNVPKVFDWPDAAVTMSPAAVERAFIKENEGLKADGIAVTCSGRRLREVRICLTKSLGFRTCSEVNARGCRRDEITAPPSRGG